MLATSTRHASQGRMLGSRISCCLPRSSVLRSGLLAAVVSNTSSSRQVAAMAAGQKAVLVPIGTGTEEMEAVITIDVLRRAGAAVTVASVENSLEVTCERYSELTAHGVCSNWCVLIMLISCTAALNVLHHPAWCLVLWLLFGSCRGVLQLRAGRHAR